MKDEKKKNGSLNREDAAVDPVEEASENLFLRVMRLHGLWGLRKRRETQTRSA